MYTRKSTLQYLNIEMERYGGYSLWLCFRALPAVTIAAVLLLLFTINSATAEINEDIAPGGVQAGQLLMHDPLTGQYSPTTLLDSKVHFDISGMVARVQVEQTFSNDSDEWAEAVYAFPLPETAAVRAMEMLVGERRIIGKIREKSIAREIYQQAKRAGKKASLVEQQRPNLFTNRVANIGPSERITVRLEYIQAVEFIRGEFVLRFPMTITPRYIPGRPISESSDDLPHATVAMNPYLGWALPTDQVPDADAITPLLYPGAGDVRMPVNPIEITASLDAGMPLAQVTSPYHELAMARKDNRYDIRLARGFSEMNRDFVLSWQTVTGTVPQAAMFTEELDGEHYGLMMVVPPALTAVAATETLSREVIFVIDTSGSMGGVAIEQARASLGVAVQQLAPGDSFNIIEFNSSYRALYPQTVLATRHNVQRALEFVRQLDAGGGTEMLSALRAALTAQSPEKFTRSAAVQQVIFITDGAVGNEQELYREITRQLGARRLFTVGIGSAPNAWFMRKAAQFGRGTHIHIGDLSEVADKMASLFEQISSPVAADIAVKWPGSVESYPARVPDLYRGQLLIVAVKSTRGPLTGEVLVEGEMAGRVWSRRLTVPVKLPHQADTVSHPGIASLWARQKITDEQDKLVTGKAPDEVRQAVLDVALSHSLLSPYTSFLAVEERISRPVGEGLQKTAVANSRPRGQSPQHYAYPRTATTAPANLLLGSLLLFFALMVYVMRREEVDCVATAQA